MEKDKVPHKHEDAQDILDEFFKEYNPKPEDVIRDAKFCFSPEKTGCNGCPRYTDKCIGAWGAIECQEKMRADVIKTMESQKKEIEDLNAKVYSVETECERLRTVAVLNNPNNQYLYFL